MVTHAERAWDRLRPYVLEVHIWPSKRAEILQVIQDAIDAAVRDAEKAK